jgi:hypothetical protein
MSQLETSLTANQYYITYQPEISLAMYRELAAHLEQINGVKVTVVGQKSEVFSYLGSQVAGLDVTVPENLPTSSQGIMRGILGHYGMWYAEPPLFAPVANPTS